MAVTDHLTHLPSQTEVHVIEAMADALGRIIVGSDREWDEVAAVYLWKVAQRARNPKGRYAL